MREPAATEVVERALAAIEEAADQVRRGTTLSEVTYQLGEAFHEAVLTAPELSERILSEFDAVRESVEVARTDLALVVHPLDTSTITEDMATAMHLHAMGWSSVYHHEVLVHGLAPDDAKTMLTQRQRWAAGSMQVFFKDNPLFVTGLSLAQRLMYLATMTSYLNGFAALVFIAAPIVYLTTGIFPLVANPVAFFALFLPSFISCQVLFQVAGRGSRGLWRGQQMSFALFPTWIAATLSGAAATFLGKHLSFAVTAKTKQSNGPGYQYVRPQLITMGLLIGASAIGVARLAAGLADVFPTLLTLGWVAMDLALLGVVIGVARYQGPGDEVVDPTPPNAELDRVLSRLQPDSVTDASPARRA